MPGSGPKARHWCFTLNNYTPEDLDKLSTPIDGVDHLVFGKEIGASGTPHLQGYVCFQSRKRRSQAITIIGQAHFSVTKFIHQSIEYCKKDGDFIEWGEPPSGKGTRSEIEDFKSSVKEGITDLAELREAHSEVIAKHKQFAIDYIADQLPPVIVEPHPLREWQQTLHNRLILSPDKREIIFIVDVKGNSGKSWFAQYYCDLHDNAQIVIPGKKADMAYVIDQTKKVFFFDCPRSKQGDFIQYDFLEELKNGLIFSPKYESRVKRLNTPHVVVCMNEFPDMSKLSRDRYSVTRLED